jgi:hypothetical protein
MDGAERMLRATAGCDIECPLRGADAVPQHDNRNGEPNLHVQKPRTLRFLGLVVNNRTEVRKSGGAKGIRTPDLLHAILMTLRTDV